MLRLKLLQSQPQPLCILLCRPQVIGRGHSLSLSRTDFGRIPTGGGFRGGALDLRSQGAFRRMSMLTAHRLELNLRLAQLRLGGRQRLSQARRPCLRLSRPLRSRARHSPLRRHLGRTARGNLLLNRELLFGNLPGLGRIRRLGLRQRESLLERGDLLPRQVESGVHSCLCRLPLARSLEQLGLKLGGHALPLCLERLVLLEHREVEEVLLLLQFVEELLRRTQLQERSDLRKQSEEANRHWGNKAPRFPQNFGPISLEPWHSADAERQLHGHNLLFGGGEPPPGAHPRTAPREHKEVWVRREMLARTAWARRRARQAYVFMLRENGVERDGA
eukprot:scaffold6711_cov118-Isochrysis_galbana.AAC.20